MPHREALTTSPRVNVAKQWLILLAPFHLLLSAQAIECAAAEDGWKAGAEFDSQLALPTKVRWAGAHTLRGVLASLADNQRVAIFLDRRVDPDQPVALATEEVPLRDLVQRLAEHLKLGVGRVGPVLYLGPSETAQVLGTVAALKQEADLALPSALRSKLRRTETLSWPELATPRDLIVRLAADAGLQVDGLEQVPHDLWPQGELPPLNFPQAMSLILAGFGLTFDYAPEGSAIRLHALPAKASITRRIPTRGSPALVATEIRRRFPGVPFTIEGGYLVVDSTIEVADAIGRLLDGSSVRPKPPAAAKGEKRYTLRKTTAPLGAVADAVAKQAGLELRFDPRAQDLRDKIVWIEVQDATLDQLLQILLEPAGLTYRIDQQTLEIRPAASP
ncbi:MAG TPA: hypothetical protein PLF81_29740 [Candidatus Anammoximicrobium sp.]|nr:hypothetical protein [Candidatus Anammoximicrobium sp.]